VEMVSKGVAVLELDVYQVGMNSACYR